MLPAAVFDIVPGSGGDGRAEFPPGPQLAWVLAGQRLDALSDAELTEVMAAARRQTSWTQALELSAVAELSRRRHLEEHGPASVGHWTSEIHEIVTEEVSLALTVTGTVADLSPTSVISSAERKKTNGGHSRPGSGRGARRCTRAGNSFGDRS
jgi:hypothetical protein